MANKACPACRKPIVFIRTKKGKNMPCEPDPIGVEDAKIGDMYQLKSGETIRFSPEKHADLEELYVPHWDICHNPNTFRGAKQ